MDAHLLAGEVDERRRPVGDVLALAVFIDRDRRVVAMRHRPDDVLGAECRIAAEEDVGQRRLHRHRVDDRHAPFVERDADILLDPREGILLADRDQHVVARDMDVRLAGRYQVAPSLLVILRRNLLEDDAGQAAVFMAERLGDVEIEDRDVLVHGVLLLPGGRFHLLEAAAHDDGDLLAAEPARRAAAIHRRVAAAEHDDALADLLDMAEGDARQPVDADMDVGGGLPAAGNVEIAAARRAGADEDRVVALRKQRLHAVDALPETRLDAAARQEGIEDVADLLVDHRLGQAEARYLGADHAAGLGIAVIDDDLVAVGQEVARHGQRGRAGAHQGDALAILLLRCGRQAVADVVLVVGGDALQAADRHRLVLDPAASAGGLAGTVAGPPEDSGEDIGLPVDHIGVAIALRRDQPDVFGNGGMGGTGPLAVHHLMEIGGVGDIGGLQNGLLLNTMFELGRHRSAQSSGPRGPAALVRRRADHDPVGNQLRPTNSSALPIASPVSPRDPPRKPCRHSPFLTRDQLLP